jgi:hypothetical protein
MVIKQIENAALLRKQRKKDDIPDAFKKSSRFDLFAELQVQMAD